MKIFFTLFFAVAITTCFAQQIFTVRDSFPVATGGLKVGYSLVSEKEKEVGSKGNFSRFSVEFYVSNISAEAKVILFRQGFNLLNSDVSPDLVKFRCQNATGARLTSKELTLQARPCIVQAITEDKDCASGKVSQNKKPVKIGYWIKPGETISARTIMIVPLNEKPDMSVIIYPDPNAPVASMITPGVNMASASSPIQGFMKIKNVLSGEYLNIEHGPLSCSVVNNEWWSAQWQLIPIQGTTYFSIQNRWKNSFLSLDNSGLLSSDNQSANSMWVVESVDGGASYTIKNAARNAAILNQSGVVVTGPLFKGQQNSKWSLEPQ
jgi:hypothetical protein